MKKCPFCGEEIQEAAVKCKHCKEWLSKTGEPSQQPVNIPAQDERSVSSSNSHQKAAITVYAGFWRRFVAAIIDTIILAIGGVLIGGISGGIIGYVLGTGVQEMIVLGYIFSVVLDWLYFTLLESSSKQATLGKMAIGITVTDLNGSRISFGKANGRYWGKMVSGIILAIGFLMAGFTQKKQALHDIMAGCLVIRVRETWCSRHNKGLSALIISIPIVAAIVIPYYVGVQERARNAQNEQVPAPEQTVSYDEWVSSRKNTQTPAPAPSPAWLELIEDDKMKIAYDVKNITFTNKNVFDAWTKRIWKKPIPFGNRLIKESIDLHRFDCTEKSVLGLQAKAVFIDGGTADSQAHGKEYAAPSSPAMLIMNQVCEIIQPPAPPSTTPQTKYESPTPNEKFNNSQTELASVPAPEPQSPVKRITERVVTDKETGLVWTWEANLAGKTMTWEGANYFIESLNEQKYEGYNDWRLPTVAELKTLSKNMQSYRLDFQNVQKNYWTATFETGVNHTVASVDMNDGYVWYKSKSEKTYVLPVRVNQKK